MKLSNQQSKAFDEITKWTKTRDPVYKLAGFAGTGKTYLLQYLVNNLDKPVLCCTPTGKAASVLQSKLKNVTVTTIHRLLYKPMEPDTSNYDELAERVDLEPNNMSLKRELDRVRDELQSEKVSFALSCDPVELRKYIIIIDEASMVTERIMKDLLDVDAKVLFVGDSGQLPPVKSKLWFSNPNFILTDVHRQALDSPIIRLSVDIRNGGFNPRDYQTDDCRVIERSELTSTILATADQVITGKNNSRRSLNKVIRKRKGYVSELPMKGEKLICIKNERLKSMTYINGVQFTTLSDAEKVFGDYTLDIDYDGQVLKRVKFDHADCQSHYDTSVQKRMWKELTGIREFDYGYAITCHKSQGSEWDNVIVADDEMQERDSNFRKRWLYTAVTRASKQLTLVQ